MPKPSEGRAAAAVAAMPGAVYTPFDLARSPRPLIPLHVGDTWMEPFVGARMEDLRERDWPGLHRYVDTRGLPQLIDAVVQRARERSGLACERENVLIAAGATSGLACAVSALADPGEEVLVLAPFWPLIRGIARSLRATPVEVPFFDRVSSEREAIAALEAKRTARTVAVYFSNPSNPTGRVLSPAWLEALAAWARSRDLWILADEVYEEFVYQGERLSIGRLAPERTLTAFSFSKTYGMAGNRAGYLVGPRVLIDEAHKVSVHSAYQAPTAAQLAGLRALEGGAAWVANAKASYAEVGREAARILGVPSPEGGCFLFVDVGARLDARGLTGFLEDCLEAGVVVAPGSSAGEAYGRGSALLHRRSARAGPRGCPSLGRAAGALGEKSARALDQARVGAHSALASLALAPFDCQPNAGIRLSGRGKPRTQHPSEGVSMKIRPLHDRILIKRVEEEQKTAGGIIIPDTAKEKPQEGRVVAVGTGKVTDEGKVIPLEVSAGDRILFSKYSGSEINLDGEEHLIIRQDDVLAILGK